MIAKSPHPGDVRRSSRFLATLLATVLAPFVALPAPAGQDQAFTLTVRPAPDFVTGEGTVAPAGNQVRVFKRDASPTSVAFSAYAAGAWGVHVASGDVDGATYDEILTGPGPGDIYGPHVRAFTRTGAPIAKVNFYAYGTLRYGVKPSDGRLDGDPFAEILTAPGPGAVFGPHVRGFDYDGTSLRPISKVSFYAYATLKYGANVAAGLLDTDGYEEIVTGPGPGVVFAPQVRGFDYDAATVRPMSKVNFLAFAISWGAKVDAGDLDADGYSEILAASVSTAPTEYCAFDYDGVSVSGPTMCWTPFPLAGGHLGAGDVTADARAEAVFGNGPGGATTMVQAYDGPTVVVSFSPFTAPTGATVAVGGLGHF